MFNLFKGRSGERFVVRKLWFEEEYYIYDKLKGEFLTFFGSREEADEFCVRLNGYYCAVNDKNMI